MNLELLGKGLKERRETLGMPRTTLAHKVGKTPTYIYLVEEAKAAKGRRPTRPRRDVLTTWAEHLGMEPRYIDQVLILAGYDPSDPDSTLPLVSHETVSESEVLAALVHSPARFPQPLDVEHSALEYQLQQILADARSQGRNLEIAGLIRTLLDFVAARSRIGKTLLPLFGHDMSGYSPDDLLIEAMREMTESRFSQVVVRSRGRLTLLTEEGITRWRLASADMGVVSLSEVWIADVLAHEAKNVSQVMGGHQTVGDAVEAFVASLERSEPLQAIIVTSTGRSNEGPEGIVTAWDLASLTGSGNY